MPEPPPKSSIYTRSGDRGQTSLADDRRVDKDSMRVEAYGTLDEANSWVGLAIAKVTDPELEPILTFLQHRLYNCSSRVATSPGDGDEAPVAGVPAVTEADVASLERAIDRLDARSGPIRVFVLPGGCEVAAALHVARTVCRRAERRLVTLAAGEPVDRTVMRFVNRASDLLFAAARHANATHGCGDVAWDQGAAAGE